MLLPEVPDVAFVFAFSLPLFGKLVNCVSYTRTGRPTLKHGIVCFFISNTNLIFCSGLISSLIILLSFFCISSLSPTLCPLQVFCNSFISV